MANRFIVAVTGSAGSNAALQDIFRSTPHPEVSYVVLRHLPKGFVNLLRLILVRHCSMDIIGVRDGMELKKNTIYVAPPSKNIAIMNDVFSVSESFNKTADFFMFSLARHYGPRAIGVVLSGAGDNGKEGIRSITESGGLTIAQDPANCVVSDMPENAIETGCIQHILEPIAIPGRIHAYVTALQRRLDAVKK